MTHTPEERKMIGSVPVPDPTVLTTQALLREIGSLREILEARMTGTERTVGLLQNHLNDRQSAINAEIVHLQKLHEEKFKSIQVQFVERDTRTEQTSKDSKVAVDAALQAAKEAVGEQNKSSALAIAKSEAATTKQIDAIGALIATTNKAIDEKIDDLKTRMNGMSGHTKGLSDGWGYLVAVIGIVAAAVAIMSHITK